MGNPAWGHGYHEGYGDGARQGSALTAAAVVVVGGAIVGAKWSYNKLRQRRMAECEQSTETMNILAAADTGHPSSTISLANLNLARGVRAALAWDTKASCV